MPKRILQALKAKSGSLYNREPRIQGATKKWSVKTVNPRPRVQECAFCLSVRGPAQIRRRAGGNERSGPASSQRVWTELTEVERRFTTIAGIRKTGMVSGKTQGPVRLRAAWSTPIMSQDRQSAGYREGRPESKKEATGRVARRCLPAAAIVTMADFGQSLSRGTTVSDT